MPLKEAAAAVKKNKSFLITSHLNPEGDALGSELAFYRMLKKLGKEAVIVNEDRLSPEYGFLPGVNNIKTIGRGVKNIKFDCFVILDCSGYKRCGQVYKLNADRKPVLNIDHHISNEYFADINWVEPAASSCSEMIYKLCKKLRVPLNKQMAMSLYTGILTDTGSFRYRNTAESTHRMAAELLKHGLDVAWIYKNIYENIPLADMKLLSRILPALRCDFKGRVAWLQVKHGLLKGKKISFDLSEHLLSFARAIKGVEVAVLFKENLGVKNEIRVNFRSQGKVDVNKVAQFFGGGGHKSASGATIRGRIEEVRRKVLAKIKENLR